MNRKVLVVYRELSEAEPYRLAVEAAGMQPVLEEAKPGLTIGDCAGLLLTGGGDVNPALYGESAHPKTQEPDDERDSVEGALIDEALERDIPMLCICRGMQMLNVHLGGTLIQHLHDTDRHVKRPPERGLPAHEVKIEPGTLLSGIANQDAWEVNSRHHQAVGKPGTGLKVCATDAQDKTIEAVELPGHKYVVAVQWHPENQAPINEEQRKIFQSFANAL